MLPQPAHHNSLWRRRTPPARLRLSKVMFNPRRVLAAPGVLLVGAAVHSGDTIRTGTLGEVHLHMSDGGLIALRAKTTFRIDS